MNSAPPRPIDQIAALEAAFVRSRLAARAEPAPDLAVRRRRLRGLEALLHDHMDEFAAAIAADFGHRSPHETRLLEMFPSLEAIRHAHRHVGRWMRPAGRPVSLWFQPARAEVRPQPLGCVGIVAPWNYPVFLTAGPLAAAFAAGNRALVKLSEFTPATAALMARLAPAYFAADELAVVEGDAEVARAFARLPFDHLLFTGSTAVGRQVMGAAAENLTPLTLELGGKSPAIVAPGYPLAKAAERILVGKCLNAGQTCIAPDYVLLPAGSEDDFLAAARATVTACYPDFARNPDYSAIVNDRHFRRLVGYLEDARAAGAEIVPLVPACPPDPASRRLPPTAIVGAAAELPLMREEIFGPLLPIVPYTDLDAAIAYVNERERPLALYLFDTDRGRIERVLDNTVSGGVTVNDTILHIAQDSLPFGGVGASGMGHYHGREGFLAFSKLKPVFRQSRLNAMGLFKPPYGRLFEGLVRLLLR